ncbi:stage II sporulation protein D [Cohnella caldifontis]|uniref:stage II sporulation protein D n=1 Tax=Cohnella caldifontis TaxID=3027471 RepID=UPI0023EC88F3|nr:stage II sporulation protein D [Cohnella sp. YIM B05605]
MKTSSRVEWAAFASGMAIAAILWLGIHNRDASPNDNVQAQVAEVQWGRGDKPSAERDNRQLGDAVPGQAGKEADGQRVADSEQGPAGRKSSTTEKNRSQPRGGQASIALTEGGEGQQPAVTGRSSLSSEGQSSIGKSSSAQKAAEAEADLHLTVGVYLTKERRIERVPLETYVRGVVAGEMPAEFEPAALEAQALAARTYIVRRLLLRDDSNVPVQGADVTDTQTHQVYISQQAMDDLRKKDEQAWRKADEAASRTAGWIIAYHGEPIQALYFSTSNGYTENSEDVFPDRIPYLRSVVSPWDRTGAPRSEGTVEMTIGQFYAKLGIRTVPVLTRLGGHPKIKVTEWTQGKRVKTVTVGSKTFTGPEIRSKLGLRSSSFTWTVQDGEIRITTHGSGHGVGMSQWGAQGMAQAGRSAEEIVEYYYTGTELMEVSKLADKL